MKTNSFSNFKRVASARDAEIIATLRLMMAHAETGLKDPGAANLSLRHIKDDVEVLLKKLER